MNDWMREVDYATYCPKCKNFKVLETDEPCNECLTECAREGSKKPVKFEEARVRITFSASSGVSIVARTSSTFAIFHPLRSGVF